MSLISLPATALAACGQIAFEMRRSQEALTLTTGVTQITSWPDRRWFARLSVNPKFDSQLLAWSLALDQLSDLSNHFALGPPHYRAPSTGYAGSNPLVNGGSQLGLSLAVDGLPNSTAILLAGDFISFDTTSPLSNTNRQLIKVASNVTSNGSGEATISLVTPIREAPANNATVNVATPTAFFRFSRPMSSIDLQPGNYSSFVIEAEERIWP
jgi:hypothetical protein